MNAPADELGNRQRFARLRREALRRFDASTVDGLRQAAPDERLAALNEAASRQRLPALNVAAADASTAGGMNVATRSPSRRRIR